MTVVLFPFYVNIFLVILSLSLSPLNISVLCSTCTRGLYYYCNYQANCCPGRCLQGGIRSNDDRTPPAKVRKDVRSMRAQSDNNAVQTNADQSTAQCFQNKLAVVSIAANVFSHTFYYYMPCPALIF